MITASYIILGIFVGVFSGFLGLGGGIIMIPALVYLYGFTQHQAQGTSLAVMIPPITLLAALKYYHNNNVKMVPAILIACGFALGGFIGAGIVQGVHDTMIKKVFGLAMLGMSIKMLFF